MQSARTQIFLETNARNECWRGRGSNLMLILNNCFVFLAPRRVKCRGLPQKLFVVQTPNLVWMIRSMKVLDLLNFKISFNILQDDIFLITIRNSTGLVLLLNVSLMRYLVSMWQIGFEKIWEKCEKGEVFQITPILKIKFWNSIDLVRECEIYTKFVDYTANYFWDNPCAEWPYKKRTDHRLRPKSQLSNSRFHFQTPLLLPYFIFPLFYVENTS